MNIVINIEAETIIDFYTHLTVLQKQIKKEAKRLKLAPQYDEFPSGAELDDDNCYGSHTVSITPEMTDPELLVPHII